MGTCETCAKEKECRKDIGIIFGFCNIDYTERKEEKKNENQQQKCV